MSRIFSFFFILFLAISSASWAEENIYLVEGISAKSTTKSPSTSRTSAVANARRDAFLILLTRLGKKTKLADEVTNDEIADMVRSEQINDERIAGSAYSATLNILFAQDFVEHILSQKTSPTIVETTAPELYLLIPAEVIKRKIILWEEDNSWKKAVEKSIKKKAKGTFITPEADLSNIASINAGTIATTDYQKLEPVISKYNASAAYTMFFNYDTIENKVVIDVFYIRKLQKKQLKLSFVNVDRLGYEALVDKVADKTVDYLLNAKNNETKNLNSNLIRIGIKIATLSDWLMVKNKIENSNFVNQFRVESISRDYAVISVNYIDGRFLVEEAFAKIGLSLDLRSENFYTTAVGF